MLDNSTISNIELINLIDSECSCDVSDFNSLISIDYLPNDPLWFLESNSLICSIPSNRVNAKYTLEMEMANFIIRELDSSTDCLLNRTFKVKDLNNLFRDRMLMNTSLLYSRNYPANSVDKLVIEMFGNLYKKTLKFLEVDMIFKGNLPANFKVKEKIGKIIINDANIINLCELNHDVVGGFIRSYNDKLVQIFKYIVFGLCLHEKYQEYVIQINYISANKISDLSFFNNEGLDAIKRIIDVTFNKIIVNFIELNLENRNDLTLVSYTHNCFKEQIQFDESIENNSFLSHIDLITNKNKSRKMFRKFFDITSIFSYSTLISTMLKLKLSILRFILEERYKA